MKRCGCATVIVQYEMFLVTGSRPLLVTVSWSSAVGKFLFVFGRGFNIIINAYKTFFTYMDLASSFPFYCSVVDLQYCVSFRCTTK